MNKRMCRLLDTLPLSGIIFLLVFSISFTTIQAQGDISPTTFISSRKVVVLIGDAPAHSAPSGLRLGIFTNAYGGDPGRDEIMFTSDDLDYFPVIQMLRIKQIIVFTIDYMYSWGWSYADDAHANLEYIATQTGGKRYYGWNDWHKLLVEDIVKLASASKSRRIDVVFIVDLTGSMSSNFRDIKYKLKELINLLPTNFDIGFGLGTFVDYPGYYSSYGYAATYGSASYGDYAWKMNLDITTDRALIKRKIDSDIPDGFKYWGGDVPECYVRALYESQFFSWRD